MNFVSKAEVIEVTTHQKNIKEYLVKLEKNMKYSPGSFVQLTLELVSASDIWPESRTFSIASYQKGLMRFIIKNVGNYTNRIFQQLNVGDYCTIKYPFGNLFKKNTVEEEHVYIAGGLGITPYLGLIEYFKTIDKLENIHLIYSVKHQDNLLHLRELKELLGERLTIFTTQDNSKDFINRRIQIDDIRKIADINTNIYICGGKAFNLYLKRELEGYGYYKIHMDDWE